MSISVLKKIAARLNNIQYQEYKKLEEMAPELREKGLIVLIGCSDDYAELFGAVRNEAHGLFDGGEIYLDAAGIYEPECDSESCPHEEKLKAQYKVIKALWDVKDDDGKRYSWKYETTIPHAPFDVREGDDYYCRAIVFHMGSLE